MVIYAFNLNIAQQLMKKTPEYQRKIMQPIVTRYADHSGAQYKRSLAGLHQCTWHEKVVSYAFGCGRGEMTGYAKRSGEWRVASGEWRVASGEWRVASGEWRVARQIVKAKKARGKPLAFSLWSCGPVVLWSCGPVVLWSCGPVVLWSCGPVVLWSCGPVVLWSCGPVGPVVLQGRLSEPMLESSSYLKT